ncbi:MAG TPA: hypothetical protein DDY49_04020 [Paenibacillaceae bacterium]|nr:hypothetical protein [Paenibacillaceae bacterium]
MKHYKSILQRIVALITFCDRCALESSVLDGEYHSVDERNEQRQRIYNWLVRHEYIDFLTKAEKRIFNTTIEDIPNQNIRLMYNQYEAVEPLLWSVGLVSRLTSFEKYVLKDFHPILMEINEKFEDMIKENNLKDLNEIVQRRELTMLWHWRARVGQQKLDQNIDEIILSIFGDEMKKVIKKIKLSKEFPKDFIAFEKPYYQLSLKEIELLKNIVSWRHHAYEWITSDEEWDDVDTST